MKAAHKEQAKVQRVEWQLAPAGALQQHWAAEFAWAEQQIAFRAPAAAAGKVHCAFCTECGARALADAKFCRMCGVPLRLMLAV